MTVPRKNLEQKEPSPSYRECLRNARLLRALKPPPVPAELSDPSFLEGIYERAAADDLGGLLQEALPRRSAPEEVVASECWARNAVDRPELVAHFRGSAGSRAPGWLWQRIQADLRRQQAARRRQTRVFRLRAAAAAAVLLVLGAGLSAHLFWREPANSEAVEPDSIQVQPLEEPLGQAFHPTDRLRLIAGGGE